MSKHFDPPDKRRTTFGGLLYIVTTATAFFLSLPLLVNAEEDKLPDCEARAAGGQCSTHPQFMFQNCLKSCKKYAMDCKMEIEEVKALKEHNTKIATDMEALKEESKTVLEKDEKIKTLEAQIADIKAKAHEEVNRVAEDGKRASENKTLEIAKLKEDLDGKNKELQEKETAKNKQVAELDGNIAERDSKIAEKDKLIAEKDAKLVEKDTRILEQDAEIKKLREELEKVKADGAAVHGKDGEKCEEDKKKLEVDLKESCKKDGEIVVNERNQLLADKAAWDMAKENLHKERDALTKERDDLMKAKSDLVQKEQEKCDAEKKIAAEQKDAEHSTKVMELNDKITTLEKSVSDKTLEVERAKSVAVPVEQTNLEHRIKELEADKVSLKKLLEEKEDEMKNQNDIHENVNKQLEEKSEQLSTCNTSLEAKTVETEQQKHKANDLQTKLTAAEAKVASNQCPECPKCEEKQCPECPKAEEKVCPVAPAAGGDPGTCPAQKECPPEKPCPPEKECPPCAAPPAPPAAGTCEAELATLKTQIAEKDKLIVQRIDDHKVVANTLDDTRDQLRDAEEKLRHLEAEKAKTDAVTKGQEDAGICEPKEVYEKKLEEVLADKNVWIDSNKALKSDLEHCKANSANSATNAAPNCEEQFTNPDGTTSMKTMASYKGELQECNGNNDKLKAEILASQQKFDQSAQEHSALVSQLRQDITQVQIQHSDQQCGEQECKQFSTLAENHARQEAQQECDNLMKNTPSISAHACANRIDLWASKIFIFTAAIKLFSLPMDMIYVPYFANPVHYQSYSAEQQLVGPWVNSVYEKLAGNRVSARISTIIERINVLHIDPIIKNNLRLLHPQYYDPQYFPETTFDRVILILIIYWTVFILWHSLWWVIWFLTLGYCCGKCKSSKKEEAQRFQQPPPRQQMFQPPPPPGAPGPLNLGIADGGIAMSKMSVKAVGKTHSFESEFMQF